MRHPGPVRVSVRVAIDARKLRVVGRNLVAVRANRSVVWDRKPGVIKGRPCPRGRRVAGVAGRRIAGGDVVRDGAAERLRARPIGLMAAIASRVGGRQRVVVVDMALRTRLYPACRRHDVASG